jgi:tripartite-type tricarboxylate transporter receptor subunit TctC
MAKLDITHVPYKGIGQVIGDLLGNHVQFAIAPLPAVESNIKSGRLKALAVTGPSRYAPLPDLPTIAEAGVPGYAAINWFGILAPARVSPPIIAKLNGETNRVIQLRDVNERLRSIGADPVGGSPAGFARHIRADTDKWARLIKDAGIEISR